MSAQQQTMTVQQALDLAVQHHKAGRLSQAESICQQILQNDPNQTVTLHLLGVIAHQTGNNDKAVDLITKVLAIKPELAEAHNNLGLAFQDLGKLEKAVASYHKALGLKPDYAEAHNNLGNALQSLGRLHDAVASYQKALHIRPDYAEMHNNLGSALKGLGNQEEAVTSYNKALGINPDYAEAHNNLGRALQELGKLDEAVTCYHKALALKPGYAEAHYNLGNVLQELGELDDGIASHRRAATHIIAQYMDKNILGNHSDAEQILKNICRKNTFLAPSFYVWAFIDTCCENVNQMLDRRAFDIAGENIRWLYMLVTDHQTFNESVQRYFNSVDGDGVIDMLGVHAKAVHLSMQSQYFYQNGQYDAAEECARRSVNETKLFFGAEEQREDSWLLVRKSLKNIRNSGRARMLLEQLLLTIVK